MARRSARRPAVAPPLILDAGAVIALARGSQRARAYVERAIETGTLLLIPSVTIAETTRGDGPRDAPVNRVLAAVDAVLDADEATGRTAGRLLGRARSNATIDALVVAGAVEQGGGRILTGDVRDMRQLARDSVGVTIHTV